MKHIRLIAAFAAAALSALPASAMDIATARGSVAVEAMPKTIAVYDVAAIDTLTRLGIRPAGLPDKLYLPELEPAKEGATVVGTLFEPDLEALSALYKEIWGKVLLDRYELLNPLVQVVGEGAVLTFNYVSYSGETEFRWNCTEVYRRDGDDWHIIQTHWSYTNAGRPVGVA